MMKQQTQREQLSALADGQLPDEEWASALDFAATDEGRETWQVYQLIGDVLRSPELARQTHDDGAFLARLRQGLAQEPLHGMPPPPVAAATTPPQLPEIPQPATFVPKAAANDSVFRWQMLAGVASLATVAALAWSTWSGSQAPAGQQWATAVPSTASEVASRTAPLAAAPATVTAANSPTNPASHPQVMLRDPRLDELLAAHQRFHGASALQLPADFLRNANFESPKR
ncbi:MAG: sigma-E factor negative regulatory protein [Burkholderiaceae bacterium]|nr:sigma-E factor negative regulatory protein [Burkholderiaceae bacterium]